VVVRWFDVALPPPSRLPGWRSVVKFPLAVGGPRGLDFRLPTHPLAAPGGGGPDTRNHIPKFSKKIKNRVLGFFGVTGI